MSTILPSIAKEARPAALALAFSSMTLFACATSSAEGEYNSLTMVTCAGWMQLAPRKPNRSEEHTFELQSHSDLVCRLLLEKKKHQRARPTVPARTACMA